MNYLLAIMLFFSFTTFSYALLSLPTLTNLNFASSGSYVAYGRSINRVVQFVGKDLPYHYNATKSEQQELNTTLVVDVVNQRMMLNVGNQDEFSDRFDGKYFYFKEKSYILLYEEDCKMSSYTFNDHINNYHNLVNIYGIFSGLHKDLRSCYDEMASSIQLDGDGYIKIWSYSRPWFVQLDTNWLKMVISGTLIFDEIYPMTTVSDSYFTLPNSCKSPSNFCDSLYPPKNATTIIGQ